MRSLLTRIRAALLWSLFLVLPAAAVPDLLEAAELPQVPARWGFALQTAATEAFGVEAPVARLAAQIHAESSWRPTARSPYAIGLAQFTPATADWMAERYPHLRPAAPWDPGWSIRAMVAYNAWLYGREAGRWRSDADRWAAALTGYVGGPGWVDRERRAALRAGSPDDRWWHGVEAHCLRSQIACRESRHYSRRILCELEPRYAAAGWPGRPFAAACEP